MADTIAHARPVALASAGLVDPAPDAPPAAHRLADDVRRWADGAGIAIVQLPARGLDAAPDADAAARRRLGRRDTAALKSVLAEVRRGEHAGRPLVALLIAEDEVAGQTGRAWLRRLGEAATAAGIGLPRAVRLNHADPLDADLLDRRTLTPAD